MTHLTTASPPRAGQSLRWVFSGTILVGFAAVGCWVTGLSGCGSVRPVERPWSPFVVIAGGDSMRGGHLRPAKLADGARAQYRVDPAVPFSRVRVGDIIVYRQRFAGAANGWWLHGVTMRRGNAVRCKGTANPEDDPGWVTAVDYVGVVVAVADVGKSNWQCIRNHAHPDFAAAGPCFVVPDCCEAADTPAGAPPR